MADVLTHKADAKLSIVAIRRRIEFIESVLEATRDARPYYGRESEISELESDLAEQRRALDAFRQRGRGSRRG